MWRNNINPLLENNNDLRRNWLKTSLNTAGTLDRTNRQIDLKALFNDLTFENIVGFIKVQMVVTNMQSQDLRAHIDSVLAHIESDLNN